MSLPLGEGTIFLEERCMENFKCKADILDLSNVSSRKQVQKIIPHAHSCAVPWKLTADFSQRSLVCCSRTVLVLEGAYPDLLMIQSHRTHHELSRARRSSQVGEGSGSQGALCRGMVGDVSSGLGGSLFSDFFLCLLYPTSSGSHVLYYWELFGTSLCVPRACWGASMGMQVQQSRGLCQRS